MTTRSLQREWRENIRRYGRTCIGVFPDGDSKDVNDAFIYSIGNALRGFPELLIVGLFQEPGVINHLSQMVIDRGREFEDGEFVSLGGRFPVCVIDAADTVKERYTIQATNMLGGKSDAYRVQQVVFPDKDGKFPWEEGCAEPYSRVIIHRRLDA